MTAPAPLIGRGDLADIVERLGAEIAADHPDGVVLVGVLKGAVIFLADLARAIHGIDVAIDFIAISRFAPDSGRVRILKDIELDLSGRDVVVVEDMVDTGLTANYLCRQLAERGPRRLDVCTLLDRPVRRIVPLEVRYRGVEIPDVFVLGYGLHLAELYRNLDQVYDADRRVVQADPGAYVATLYGDRDGGRDEAGSGP
ncbi:MAG: phosphoribosyltransferase [Acidimicrobiia bacterium]